MSDCPICDRCLSDWKGLQQHLQSKHCRLYCGRCQRTFPSTYAKQQHILDSSRHHICEFCSHKPDFLSEDDLDEHTESEHNYCLPCDRLFDSASQLTQHDITEHNMCKICKKYFDTILNLNNHAKTHAKKSRRCPGCGRLFKSMSAVVLHLEAGACESGVDIHWVDETAFECPWSWYYTCDDPDYEFECPTCEAPFLRMSSLFQHAESNACNESQASETSLGQFLRHLRRQIRAY